MGAFFAQNTKCKLPWSIVLPYFVNPTNNLFFELWVTNKVDKVHIKYSNNVHTHLKACRRNAVFLSGKVITSFFIFS